VLILPTSRAEFCTHLIKLYEAGGGEEWAFMRE